METLNIGIAGPSGVGKTTLANLLLEQFNDAKVQPFGAFEVLSEESKDYFLSRYGMSLSEHSQVIEKSLRDKDFAKDFQIRLRDDRSRITQFLKAENKGEVNIFDRTPIDNIIYFMIECLPRCSAEEFKTFVEITVRWLVQDFDVIIFIPCNTYEMFDGNDTKRIGNIYFQRTVSSLYQQIIEELFGITHSNKLKILKSSDLTDEPMPYYFVIDQIKLVDRLYWCKQVFQNHTMIQSRMSTKDV